MVVLNDFGLTLEIIGFCVFLFVPLQETYNITREQTPKIYNFFNTHHKTRYGLRYGGIGLIISGLIMQYQALQGII